MGDDEHPDRTRFLKIASKLDFADRYYSFCRDHATAGPDLPAPLQMEALAATGRAWRHHKRDRFFSWKDAASPEGCSLGLKLSLEYSSVEWILAFATPSGGLGFGFATLSLGIKWLTNKGYEHLPPYPRPCFADLGELATVLTEGFALYEDLAAAIRSETWA